MPHGGIAARDIISGPDEPALDAAVENGTLTCQYVEPSSGENHGASPKFKCRDRFGRKHKIKYEHETAELREKYGDNGEVFAEVAATRLLWALGFRADRVDPVTVVCMGCPEDPYKGKGPRAERRTFTRAAIERKHPARPVVVAREKDGMPVELEGWSWKELRGVRASSGGASRAELDAFRLLAAFLQHGDSKEENQRLVCDGEGPGCQPWLMINDAGATFGGAGWSTHRRHAKANFEKWKDKEIWKGRDGCEARLKGSLSGTMSDPEISEAGRALLSGLLSQLTAAQVEDLFRYSRIELREPSVPVSSWAAVFREKAAQIASRRCPE